MELPRQKEAPKETKKERLEQLSGYIAEISSRINQEFSEKFGVENFLDGDATVNMRAYAGRAGWSQEDLEKDLSEIEKREIGFSNANNENVKAFYAQEYGAKNTDDVLRIWRKNKKKDKNSQFEMAATAILHKFLAEKFAVVRASTHDDYVNGMDNILVNKETGDVICAFDEVHDHKADSRRQEKEKKIEKIASRGGTTVKYGFQILNGKLVEKEIRNLPVFYFSIATQDLEDLIFKMKFDSDGDPAEIEQQVMKNFLAGLEEQKNSLGKLNLPSAVKSNLRRFGESLETMKKMAEKRRTKNAGV
jgi:hypothetical protein